MRTRATEGTAVAAAAARCGFSVDWKRRQGGTRWNGTFQHDTKDPYTSRGPKKLVGGGWTTTAVVMDDR
jgi:hypothetical protein